MFFMLILDYVRLSKGKKSPIGARIRKKYPLPIAFMSKKINKSTKSDP